MSFRTFMMKNSPLDSVFRLFNKYETYAFFTTDLNGNTTYQMVNMYEKSPDAFDIEMHERCEYEPHAQVMAYRLYMPDEGCTYTPYITEIIDYYGKRSSVGLMPYYYLLDHMGLTVEDAAYCNDLCFLVSRGIEILDIDLAMFSEDEIHQYKMNAINCPMLRSIYDRPGRKARGVSKSIKKDLKRKMKGQK